MMPYIPQDRRAVLDAAAIPGEKGRLCNTAGEMNYCFVKMWMAQTPLLERDILDFMCAIWHQKPKYETANAIVGAYLLSLREIHRRTYGRLRGPDPRANVKLLQAFCEQHLDEYEHAKILENGDLPEFSSCLVAAEPAKAPAKKGRPGAKRRTPGRGHRNKKWRTAQ
jgi:hypothetical protein